MTTIYSSNGYSVHCTILRPVAPGGCFTIQLDSQWAGAKNPGETQRKLQLTLDFAGMTALADAVAPWQTATLRQAAEALRGAISQMQRMDERLLRITGSPYESELGEVERARAALSIIEQLSIKEAV